MSKRQSLSSSGSAAAAEAAAPPPSSARSGSKRKSSSAAVVAPLKLPRLDIIDELEQAYTKLAAKAAGAGKASKSSSSSAATDGRQLQALFDDIKAAIFGLLRAKAVAEDAAGDEEAEEVEALDRGLAKEVDQLRKTEKRLAKVVKEAREKNRSTLPAAMKAAYAQRLAALLPAGQEDEEDEDMRLGLYEEEEEEDMGGAGSSSGAGAAPASAGKHSSSRSSSRRKTSGRKSLAASTAGAVAVSTAGLRQQLQVLKDTAADVSERALAGKRRLPTVTQDVQDVLAVQGKVGKRSATDKALESAAAVPTPAKKAKR